MTGKDSITVLLSLGSNLGDRKIYLDRAIDRIFKLSIITDIITSSYYETEPIGFTNQPWFLNMAICGTTLLTPELLFKELKNIEKEAGRMKREQWHERELDIDILLYGDQIIYSSDLVIPHPRMLERAFVLIPANEIAGNILHPLKNQSIKDLLANCNDTSSVIKFRI